MSAKDVATWEQAGTRIHLGIVAWNDADASVHVYVKSDPRDPRVQQAKENGDHRKE